MNNGVFCLLFSLYVSNQGIEQYVTIDQYPVIKEVSAMCSSEGITASILFNRPFNGQIYSLNYGTVNDCIYYKGDNFDNILFSIPVHRCGTRLTRTTRNMVDQMENHVYVQMEKDAQTASDRQFLFVCQLADAKIGKEQLSDYDYRRHPIIPSLSRANEANDDGYPLSVETRKTLSNRVWAHMEPVKSNTVSRVAAYSSDGHLGNWPIPGAQPYSPSVTPVSSWPRQPLPEPIISHNRPENHFVAVALSEGGGRGDGMVQDTYVVAKNPPMSTTTSRNPFSSTVLQPIIPYRTKNGEMQQGTSYDSSQNSKIPVSPHIPAVDVQLITSSYAISESVNMNSEGDSVHLERGRMVNEDTATKIPAFPWNKPVPYSLLYNNFASRNSVNSSNTTAADYDKSSTSMWEKAKVFKMEKPGIGVEFDSDTSDKVVQSGNDVSPSRLVSTQEHFAPTEELSLEIQHGIGPYSPTVSSPVKIGDNISLVVRSKSQMKGDNEYDMFVHSCFASDGLGKSKIELIDRNGCAARPQLSSQLNRTKDPSNIMYYFFRINAFKFPGPDDVYFSCSIELTPLRNVSEICPTFRRHARETHQSNDLRLFDSVKVKLDDVLMTTDHRRRLNDDNGTYDLEGFWISSSLLTFFVMLFITLLAAVLLSTTAAWFFYRKLSKLNSKSLYFRS